MTSRPNDLYLFGPYPPPYGGVSIFMDQLTAALKQRDIAHTLKCFHNDAGIEGEVFLTAFSVLQHFWRMSRQTICLDSCSFFIEYPSRRIVTAWLALKYLRRFRWIKIIHDGTLAARYQEFPTDIANLSRRAIRHVDEFIVVNQDIKNWLHNEMNIQQPVHYIPSLLPLVDHGDVAVPAAFDHMQQTYDKIVCALGVFDTTYDFATVARAVEQLRQSTSGGNNIGLVLIDGAFTRDEVLKTNILKNRDWITVLNEIPHPQVLAVLAKSDVFVRGVERESFGISKIEALWMQTPVVSTNSGETRGMRLYDFGDETQLVQQIRAALFDMPTDDVNRWREFFQSSAHDNLARILQVIGR